MKVFHPISEFYSVLLKYFGTRILISAVLVLVNKQTTQTQIIDIESKENRIILVSQMNSQDDFIWIRGPLHILIDAKINLCDGCNVFY